ncbi:PEPxxWA-CTERM sorting domain-containing protein [Erythrobacter sp.]|uniref:PEPxxWA-CTERM sorting domain-containing protein n=1 Tax=Erythrobacter sp. TaxID=1042 RepID=UPI0025F23784|nr:PEPxxWA-CTERM sorting domain-containing protein [Erythrobacter sp.]
MRTSIFQYAVVGALAAAVPSVASAAEFVETQSQTVDGQDFVFSFPSPQPTGDGLLTLLIRGDFSGNFPGNESFDIDLEGVFSRTNLGLNTGTLVQRFSGDDQEFSHSFILTLAELSALANDGQINLNVNYAFGVSSSLSANPFITASLRFPSEAGAVPEPAAWGLMLLGFGFVGGAMRSAKRRQKANVSYA